MPPKDPIVAPIASHDRIDFTGTSTTTTAADVVVPALSPVSLPAATLEFQKQHELPSYEHAARHQQHKQQQQPLATSITLLGPHSHQLPTSFCLLPRPEEENEKESTEIPVFLAFLNKLHSGELQQQLPLQQATNLLLGTTLSVVTTTTNPNNQSKSIVIKDQLQPQQQRRKTVQFAPPRQLQTVYPVLSRHDMTSSEIQNTWYTEHYLRLKGQVQQQQQQGEDDDDYSDQFHHSSTALSSSLSSSSSSSSSLKMSQQNHTRDLTLTGMYIRRARRVVLGEQARQDYCFLHNNDNNDDNNNNNKSNIKEERIRGAYHKVTLHCSREAKARGEAAAKLAAKLS